MATKSDRERLAAKQEKVADRIKQIAALNADLLVASLPEHKVDLLLIALGMAEVVPFDHGEDS